MLIYVGPLETICASVALLGLFVAAGAVGFALGKTSGWKRYTRWRSQEPFGARYLSPPEHPLRPPAGATPLRKPPVVSSPPENAAPPLR